jgi:hypothetical protein
VIINDGRTAAIAAEIARREPVNGIRLVGIDGPSASGKWFSAHYRVRDWETDWSGDALGGRWAPTVIVEGVSSTRRATAGRLVYAAWVEAAVEVRLARGVARDAHPAGDADAARDIWRRQLAVEEAFFAADGARDRADIRMDTSGYG